MLRRWAELLQSNVRLKSRWKGIPYDLIERNLDYLDYEKELLRELERGEMKISSVITYYRMAQYMDSINEAIRQILGELTEEPVAANRII